MPLGNAQGNALVQLVLAHASRRGIHRPLEFIAIPNFSIQECSRFSRLETNLSQKSLLLVSEMIVSWLSFGMHRNITIVYRDPIVLVLGQGLPQGLDDVIGAPGIVCIHRS